MQAPPMRKLTLFVSLVTIPLVKWELLSLMKHMKEGLM
jgi:hypothetical protein